MREIQINKKTFAVENDNAFWDGIENWEKQSFEILEKFADDGAVMLDVGAYNGVLSMYGSKLFNSVYSFEPDPVAYANMVNNIKLNNITNINVANDAVSNINGNMTLHMKNAGDSISSLIDRPAQEYATLSTTDVRTIRLSEFIFNNISGRPIGLIKLDIEGGEIYVIPEMKDYISTYAPSMYISFHPNWFPEKDKSINEFVDILAATYNVFDINMVRRDYTYMVNCLYGTEHNFVFVSK